jgi:signal transduction histidine kinase
MMRALFWQTTPTLTTLSRFAFFRAAISFALLLIVVGSSGYILVTRPAIDQYAKWIAGSLIRDTDHCSAAGLSEEIFALKSRGLAGITLESVAPSTGFSGKASIVNFPFDLLLAEQLRHRLQSEVAVTSSLSGASISFACKSDLITLKVDRTLILGAFPDIALLFWVLGLIGGAIGMAAVLSRSLSIPLAKLTSHLRATPLGGTLTTSSSTRILEFDLLGEEIDNLRARASSAVASRSALLMSLSHDLRKPLTRLRLILDTESTPSEATMDEIRQDILELQGALDEFMRAANAMASPLQADGARLAWAQLQRAYSDQRLSFSGTPDSSCPAINAPALLRIGSNLIDNALQHTEGDVRVSWTSAPNWKLCISDTGPGIDKRFISEKMRPFSISHTAQDTPSILHAGLGLSLAKILCEHNGWQLETGMASGLATICVMPL